MYQYRLGHTVDLTIFTSIKPIRSLAASCVINSRSEHRRRFFISLNILDVAPEVNVVLSCGGTGANFIFFVFQALRCSSFITSLKPDNSVYRLLSIHIVDTQYTQALRTIEKISNIRGTSTNRFKKLIYKYALCIAHDQCHYFAITCLWVNKINFFFAIYFLLLLYYSSLARPIIQLFILQEVIIKMSTINQLKLKQK